ncbi:NUMOD1 domain-containing DNA-binding protein [Salinimicrobium sediminilitoris]|uniref:NUMOD1 domain-containing DNA-binding protein n=1 Tax=Salinimicrobium sediminilitoris TaxID=2876715 RepID=UPI001E381C69|nr:NUMOD1 domain-containing DNA-binding protein [Salinimicrobium sediminilitoris]MCC8361011.1 GIY-YIG nuclease family protein [Salinimicrobium sediminilitoris]
MKKIIYRVTHKETGEVYIGTTQDLDKRRRDHIQKSKSGKGYRFQEAIATHGPDAFEWEQIDSATSPNDAAEKERTYILYYDSKENGFNADCGGGIKKKIYQYDLQTGELLKVYENLAEAGNAAGVDRKTISKACLGEIKSCAGYNWSYRLYVNYTSLEDNRKKSVYQFSKEGKYLKSYKSVAEASRLTGINKSSIAKCCRGEFSVAGNFRWEYK